MRGELGACPQIRLDELPPGGPFFPRGTYARQPAREVWAHHTVVIKKGIVYDQFTHGMPIDEWKSLWGNMANDIEFGF